MLNGIGGGGSHASQDEVDATTGLARFEGGSRALGDGRALRREVDTHVAGRAVGRIQRERGIDRAARSRVLRHGDDGRAATDERGSCEGYGGAGLSSKR